MRPRRDSGVDKVSATEPICPNCGEMMLRGWDHLNCKRKTVNEPFVLSRVVDPGMEQEIADLRAQLAAAQAEAKRLREALEPFALLADECDDFCPKGIEYTAIDMRIADLRHARAALREIEGTEQPQRDFVRDNVLDNEEPKSCQECEEGLCSGGCGYWARREKWLDATQREIEHAKE